MPEPICLCLEDLTADGSPRYTRCVALVGRQPGLRLGGDGGLRWLDETEGGLELWVSLDEQLILFRPAGSVAASVHRGGRSLQLPEEKPVVLLHGDEVEVGERRLRVHVHGAAPSVAAPEPLPEERTGRAMRAAAAALALGAALTSAGCPKPVEVRQAPPWIAAPPMPKPDVKPDARPPIEVRVAPPSIAIPPPPPGEAPKTPSKK
jgi:hypothetical protein